MHLYAHACMHVYIYVCVYVLCMCVCTYVCMHACMYVYTAPASIQGIRDGAPAPARPGARAPPPSPPAAAACAHVSSSCTERPRRPSLPPPSHTQPPCRVCIEYVRSLPVDMQSMYAICMLHVCYMYAASLQYPCCRVCMHTCRARCAAAVPARTQRWPGPAWARLGLG